MSKKSDKSKDNVSKPSKKNTDLIEKGFLSLEDIKNALIDNKGHIQNTVKDLGISDRTYYTYYDKYPELEEFEKIAFQLRRKTLRETALNGLLSVINANNVDHSQSIPINLAPAKVKASEVLLKMSGELSDGKQNNDNNNDSISQLVNIFSELRNQDKK